MLQGIMMVALVFAGVGIYRLMVGKEYFARHKKGAWGKGNKGVA